MKLLANMNLDSLASVEVYLFIVPKLPKYTFLLQSCTPPLQNVFWSPKGFLPQHNTFLCLIIFFLALLLKHLLPKTEIQSSALEKEPESLDSQQQIFRDDVSATSSCCTCSEPTERRTRAQRGEVDSAQTRSKLRDNVYFLGLYVYVYLYIYLYICI